MASRPKIPVEMKFRFWEFREENMLLSTVQTGVPPGRRITSKMLSKGIEGTFGAAIRRK